MECILKLLSVMWVANSNLDAEGAMIPSFYNWIIEYFQYF